MYVRTDDGEDGDGRHYHLGPVGRALEGHHERVYVNVRTYVFICVGM
jgi:hypothetical protein